MSTDFLAQALVYLAAAVICVPIAKKLGMSSVLGYLLSGIIIGPYVLGFIGQEGQDVMHAAEFGVVMMLFLIGLELEPAVFWQMRKAIVGIGSAQVLATTIVMTTVFLIMGWSWPMSLAVALALSMSSTAIVLQTLKEKGLSRTAAGQFSFSVLLFQDIAVIPILALLPLLSSGHAAGSSEAHGQSPMEEMPGWLQAIFVAGAVVAVYLAGRFLVVPMLRYIARANLRELFTAASLLLVIAVAYLMQLVGLSPALGAFVAGVVLANSEFRHELESDIEPFKGLLLGLFFIGVGSTINFSLLAGNPWQIIMLVSLVIAVKGLILGGIGKLFGLKMDQNLLFALGLSQVGEFAFVLLSFIAQLNISDAEWTGKLMALTAISMLTTPLLLLINEKWIDPYFGTKAVEDSREADAIEEKKKVIITGFGHFGSTIGRLLRASGVEATILDNDSDRVELLRKMGFKVYYCDATRVDLLKAAGAEEASLLIAAIDSPDVNRELITTINRHFPHLQVFTRARNRMEAYELIDMGIQHIYRETLHTAVQLGVDALVALGARRYSATRQGQTFLRKDEEALRRLAKTRHDQKDYILAVRREIELQEQLLQNDVQTRAATADHSWDSQHLRETIIGSAKE